MIDTDANLLFEGQPNITFEYAYPETNYGMTNLLTSARVQETLA